MVVDPGPPLGPGTRVVHNYPAPGHKFFPAADNRLATLHLVSSGSRYCCLKVAGDEEPSTPCLG